MAVHEGCKTFSNCCCEVTQIGRNRVMRTAIEFFAGFDSERVPQNHWFGRLAVQTALVSGKPLTFLTAVFVVAVWALTGPIYYSDTWQLVINTGTTIVTFLMVFLIQATQNRDTLALQIKLSELILALEGARNELAIVEKRSDKVLENIAEDIQSRAESAAQDRTAP
jgi:low affinity Fe/Cu permease